MRMSDNVEDIEAKLAAYIDGQIDSADKAEIEKHLADNPAHAALIHDLIWHRQLMLQLPSEDAPADLSEGLRGQLEREVLLGGGFDAPPSPLRLSRWPQIL